MVGVCTAHMANKPPPHTLHGSSAHLADDQARLRLLLPHTSQEFFKEPAKILVLVLFTAPYVCACMPSLNPHTFKLPLPHCAASHVDLTAKETRLHHHGAAAAVQLIVVELLPSAPVLTPFPSHCYSRRTSRSSAHLAADEARLHCDGAAIAVHLVVAEVLPCVRQLEQHRVGDRLT
eukprot:126986-Chlamydomonas_euryale.AAC.3